ncbi:MAG: response regulator, partial [Thermodesulfobacteriota bacterium]
MKVLVIDDEKPTLSMFRLFLSAYGYTVFIAEDGEEGIRVFEKQEPEIVFTDLKMPGMDGLEVLKKIREKKIGSEVIIITGHGDIDKAIQALDFDASDFINKPVEKAALDAALKRAHARIGMTP